ncbi:Pentatricopeptide repeat-containing protein [Drosera capensis]
MPPKPHLPTQTTLTKALSLLSTPPSPLPLTKTLHSLLLKHGLIPSNKPLTTKLISLYSTQSLYAASLLFSSLPSPDLIAYSAIINVYSKYGDPFRVFSTLGGMVRNGVRADGYLIPVVLKACGEGGERWGSEGGRMVHGVVVGNGFGFDLVVGLGIVIMYVRCGRLGDAEKVFEEMPERGVVGFSAIAGGYARRGCVEEVGRVLGEMRGAGVEPNVVCWNGVISGFNQSGKCLEAVGVFREMIPCEGGVRADEGCVSGALAAVGDLGDVRIGRQIHGYGIKQGLESDKWVVTALIDMYGKNACAGEMLEVFGVVESMELGACNAVIAGLARNGLVDEALALFRRMKDQDMDLNVVSWTSMIACCSQNGKDMEAFEIFREMQLAGVTPNAVTIPCLLPACGNVAALMHGKAAHCFSARRGITHNAYVGSALIDMYAKCGRLGESRLCFDTMPNRNLVAWNSMIRGYAMHGKPNEAIELLNGLQKSGLNPDLISFVGVLSACSQKGLVDEGRYYFHSMSKDHGIPPKMAHYATMVTLLSRAGEIEEAYSMIKNMPFEPDACVWGALLCSCRVYNNVEVAEVAAKKLFELEPGNTGNYILLSNLYWSNGMCDGADKVRELMKEKGLKKNPGCCWIEINNRVHVLLAGDKSLPQTTQILEKLNALSIEMMRAGIVPKTDLVMQDVEEQDKESILSGHSEKLAVVFGLLNTPPGTPLRVIKNLRICSDCHSVIKFISKSEGREILVRDTNRFHHFTDGECSCADFWRTPYFGYWVLVAHRSVIRLSTVHETAFRAKGRKFLIDHQSTKSSIPPCDDAKLQELSDNSFQFTTETPIRYHIPLLQISRNRRDNRQCCRHKGTSDQKFNLSKQHQALSSRGGNNTRRALCDISSALVDIASAPEHEE